MGRENSRLCIRILFHSAKYIYNLWIPDSTFLCKYQLRFGMEGNFLV